jgi:pilus assembly protein Flp/PilA
MNPSLPYRSPRPTATGLPAGKEVKLRMTIHISALIDFFRSDDEGQGLAEYGLILTLIAIVAIISLIVIGGQVSKMISNVGHSV